jgi:hypothetical protein
MKWIFAIGPEPAVCLAPDRVENLLASLSLKDVPAPLRALLTPTRTASWGRDFPDAVDIAGDAVTKGSAN